MSIPRLDPSSNDLTISITVNKRLRPYFTNWYQADKLENDTPEEFIIRQLKINAMQWYSSEEKRPLVQAAKQTKQDEVDSLELDEKALFNEVD